MVSRFNQQLFPSLQHRPWSSNTQTLPSELTEYRFYSMSTLCKEYFGKTSYTWCPAHTISADSWWQAVRGQPPQRFGLDSYPILWTVPLKCLSHLFFGMFLFSSSLCCHNHHFLRFIAHAWILALDLRASWPDFLL